MDWYIALITFLYACTGVIGVVAYAPTFKDLFNKIASANPSSYGLWTFTYSVTFLYTVFVVKDMLLSIFMGVHVISCGCITFFSWRLKRK